MFVIVKTQNIGIVLDDAVAKVRTTLYMHCGNIVSSLVALFRCLVIATGLKWFSRISPVLELSLSLLSNILVLY